MSWLIRTENSPCAEKRDLFLLTSESSAVRAQAAGQASPGSRVRWNLAPPRRAALESAFEQAPT